MKVPALLGGLIAASALVFVGTASADDDDRRLHRGHGDWMSVEGVVTKLKADGYTVLEIERDDGRYEVKVVDQRGYRYEGDLNPRTGVRYGEWRRKHDGWDDRRDRDDGDDRFDD